ncbi:MAG: hypothetical protein HQL31_02870 [Planctomycetes bacterium]|nr:hypothetical protein [Planctomycetota bacterium]
MTKKPVGISVEAEEIVYSSRYSNNGSSPMWCYSNTCLVRIGGEVFASGYERVADCHPLNDCRWVLFGRTGGGWQKLHADGKGRTREPSPLGCLPPGRILLSANPTLLPPEAVGGGPARPELLEFSATDPHAPPLVLRPGWQGEPGFNEHSYRSFATDATRGEAILFQNVGCSHVEWALLEARGGWRSGRLSWPPYAPTDMAPFGASHARINYPVVSLRDRAVHFCGVAAYDNWDRVRSAADLGLGGDPNRPGASGMAGRQRGNRFRRLLYAWTGAIGERPFCDWIEIENSFDDGGWLFATDLHIDTTGTVHLLWFRSPMLPTVRDALYPDIRSDYRIEYATLRDGKLLSRQTLLRTGEDEAVPTDLDQVGHSYLLDNGEQILQDPIATPRFHLMPDGRLFVIYYVSSKQGLSENRLLEIRSDGTLSSPAILPFRFPLTQFFTATPRAGSEPSQTLDLLGHRRGDWRLAEGSGGKEWEGTISYARVRIQ